MLLKAAVWILSSSHPWLNSLGLDLGNEHYISSNSTKNEVSVGLCRVMQSWLIMVYIKIALIGKLKSYILAEWYSCSVIWPKMARVLSWNSKEFCSWIIFHGWLDQPTCDHSTLITMWVLRQHQFDQVHLMLWTCKCTTGWLVILIITLLLQFIVLWCIIVLVPVIVWVNAHMYRRSECMYWKIIHKKTRFSNCSYAAHQHCNTANSSTLALDLWHQELCTTRTNGNDWWTWSPLVQSIFQLSWDDFSLTFSPASAALWSWPIRNLDRLTFFERPSRYSFDWLSPRANDCNMHRNMKQEKCDQRVRSDSVSCFTPVSHIALPHTDHCNRGIPGVIEDLGARLVSLYQEQRLPLLNEKLSVK